MDPMTNTALDSLLDQMRARLRAQGINLWGVARIEDFDGWQSRAGRLSACSSTCRSAIVIGTGGRDHWRHLVEEQGQPGTGGANPLDRYSEHSLSREVDLLAEHGYRAKAVFPFAKRPVNFLRLAEIAGIGKLSPVVPFLLHPRYGPWISLRGALLLEEELEPTKELEDFTPCHFCHAPCLDACPVDTYGPHGHLDLRACGEHRQAGGCNGGCEVRRACPVGSAERYSSDEERFRHRDSLPILRRHFGLGFWKWLPARMRRF
jgi:hypothetical protein